MYHDVITKPADYSVKCLDDTREERHGFLWLKKRRVKIDGLTKGKAYEVLASQTAVYGTQYAYNAFTHLLMVNDNGIPQLYPIESFALTEG